MKHLIEEYLTERERQQRENEMQSIPIELLRLCCVPYTEDNVMAYMRLFKSFIKEE